MSGPWDQINIENYGEAQKTMKQVTLGHYFAFLDDARLLTADDPTRGRKQRLGLAPADDSPAVRTLVGESLVLPGLTIRAPERHIDPVGCLVSDRDLYRAERDTVHLFAAFLQPPADLRLVVEYNGQPLTERELAMSNGVAVESLSMLLPGAYSARLEAENRSVGAPVSFTVAEYALAPLSATLISSQLEQTGETLRFRLAVESYQVPFDGKLKLALVENGREVRSITLKPRSAGDFLGRIDLRGDGPFRLRLTVVDEPDKIAEVAIPGSRAQERQATVISELGQELLFAMMPEPGALPVRGGYLSEGEFNTAALRAGPALSSRRVIHTSSEVESLSLVILDLTTGRMHAQHVGSVAAGAEVDVASESPLCTVFAGCFVDGRPFEGYATFFAPSELSLEVDTAERLRPRQDLTIRLRCNRDDATVPVLLSVRDQRLTSADRPDVSMGAAVKRAIDRATEGMAESGFTKLADLYPEPQILSATFDGDPMDFLVGDGAAVEGAMFELEEERTVLRQAAPPDAGFPEAGREPVREEFPELLFYGLVPVRGTQEVVVPLADSLCTLAIDAFALSRGDWIHAGDTVIVDQPVRADLELPPAIHPGDRLSGRLRALTVSGTSRIELTHNGNPVALRRIGASQPLVEELHATPAELEFDASPGTYEARVEDPSSGEADCVSVAVDIPGRFRSLTREVAMLQAGETITADSADAVSLRVLPAMEEPFAALVTATAGYTHLCCEQTAAKILAAVFMYLTTKKTGVRNLAEDIILAGIARERQMLRPGKGFAMYPRDNYVSDHYSRLAVRYLWTLDRLQQMPGLSTSLGNAVREGLELANTAAQAHKLQRVRKRLESIEDAYSAASGGGDTAAVRRFVEATVDFRDEQAQPRAPQHRVANRAFLAYAAAALIAIGDWARGIRLANLVTRQLNEEGRLYSTVDSVAAIALMIQIFTLGAVNGNGRVRANGKEMTALDAAGLSDQIETIEVVEGIVPVEVSRIHEEDWSNFAAAFPVTIDFRDGRGRKKRVFKAGERAELVATLPDGYCAGDLLHVSLPAGMAWIQGGARVKRFTLDFEGENEVRVPVVVTATSNGKQHFAVCVRNMFEEERAATPGLLCIETRP